MTHMRRGFAGLVIGIGFAVGWALWGGWFVLWSLIGAFVFTVIGYALGGTND